MKKTDVGLLVLVFGLIFLQTVCANNSSTESAKQYRCEIAGEPNPQTFADFFRRAGKHLAEDETLKFNQCAFDAVSEAIRLDSQKSCAFALRGLLRQAQAKETNSTDLQSALADFNEAVRLSPQEAVLYQMRSSVYAPNESEKALQDLSKAIEILPDVGDFYARRGNWYFQREDLPNALNDYSKAIKLNPGDAESLGKRSEIYKKMGRQKEAQADASMKSDLEWLKGHKRPFPFNESLKTIDGGILNDKAIKLPQPDVSLQAKAVCAEGEVKIKIVVNEIGTTTPAKIISGHPLLRESALQAAWQAEFPPQKINPEKGVVSGVLIFKF